MHCLRVAFFPDRTARLLCEKMPVAVSVSYPKKTVRIVYIAVSHCLIFFQDIEQEALFAKPLGTVIRQIKKACRVALHIKIDKLFAGKILLCRQLKHFALYAAQLPLKLRKRMKGVI